MASSKQQGLVEAPVEEVWEVLSDPSRVSEWSEDVIAVTGVPTTVEKGSTFEVTGRGPLGVKATTTFKIEELEDLHEIKMQCQDTGFYSHWVVTEARGNTFAEVELGVEPLSGLQARAVAALHTKRYLRRAAQDLLDGLRGFTGPGSSTEPARDRK